MGAIEVMNAEPLERALKLQIEAVGLGFDWSHTEDVLIKLREEIVEFEEALESRDPQRISAEMGDILFTAVNLSRFVHVEPGAALDDSSRCFSRRFGALCARIETSGRSVRECSLQELDEVWQQVKREQ